MKSAAAITYELDDAALAAKILAQGVSERLSLCKNSAGVLFCDADMDCAAVTSELKALLGIEIAGMTTLATLDRDGYHEAAAILTVMTSDDCAFTVAATDALSADNYREKIAEGYARSIPSGAPASAPALIFAFCPYGLPFAGDKFPEALSELTGGAPVIGGIASDDYVYKHARVFVSGEEYFDRLVTLGIWGPLEPLFSIRHVTSRFAERIRRVTEADGNIVYRVGDETFVQYLEGFGLKTDVPDPLLAFTSYPMMLTLDDRQDEVPLMRHITNLDLETGAGYFAGDVPVGTLANMCLISKADLVSACRESLASLLQDAEAKPANGYSTIFCISCCGRAIILGSDSGAEGRVLEEMTPQSVSLSGAYCFGEICPVLYKDGKAVNRFHNCSITFCMI